MLGSSISLEKVLGHCGFVFCMFGGVQLVSKFHQNQISGSKDTAPNIFAILVIIRKVVPVPISPWLMVHLTCLHMPWKFQKNRLSIKRAVIFQSFRVISLCAWRTSVPVPILYHQLTSITHPRLPWKFGKDRLSIKRAVNFQSFRTITLSPWRTSLPVPI